MSKTRTNWSFPTLVSSTGKLERTNGNQELSFRIVYRHESPGYINNNQCEPTLKLTQPFQSPNCKNRSSSSILCKQSELAALKFGKLYRLLHPRVQPKSRHPRSRLQVRKTIFPQDEDRCQRQALKPFYDQKPQSKTRARNCVLRVCWNGTDKNGLKKRWRMYSIAASSVGGCKRIAWTHSLAEYWHIFFKRTVVK